MEAAVAAAGGGGGGGGGAEDVAGVSGVAGVGDRWAPAAASKEFSAEADEDAAPVERESDSSSDNDKCAIAPSTKLSLLVSRCLSEFRV